MNEPLDPIEAERLKALQEALQAKDPTRIRAAMRAMGGRDADARAATKLAALSSLQLRRRMLAETIRDLDAARRAGRPTGPYQQQILDLHREIAAEEALAVAGPNRSKGRGGRRSKLTPERQELICDMIRKCVPRDRAFRLALGGVEPRACYEWLEKGNRQAAGPYRNFVDAVARAEDELIQRATRVVSDLMGPTVPEAVRLNAAKFTLTHRAGRDFARSTDVQVTGPGGGPLQHAVEIRPLLSDDAIAAMTVDHLAVAIRELLGAPSPQPTTNAPDEDDAADPVG